MAISLAVAINEHLSLIEGSKPNDPDQLARYESYVGLLERIAVGLAEIATALESEAEQAAPDVQRKEISRASRIVGGLSAGRF